jgi:hypothetical protein
LSKRPRREIGTGQGARTIGGIRIPRLTRVESRLEVGH